MQDIFRNAGYFHNVGNFLYGSQAYFMLSMCRDKGAQLLVNPGGLQGTWLNPGARGLIVTTRRLYADACDAMGMQLVVKTLPPPLPPFSSPDHSLG